MAMAIHLDHLIVPSRHRRASARLVAELLGVPWSQENGIGPFSPVYVNSGLTLDFDETIESFPVGHFAFRVEPAEFDAILGRIKAAGIRYRSTPHGPVDMKVNTQHGGNIAYWNEPDGHIWEILTVSYARQAGNGGSNGAA
jgi:catechol 2,3-dioxygenase-like lactoylglutathione lyase family enzyme